MAKVFPQGGSRRASRSGSFLGLQSPGDKQERKTNSMLKRSNSLGKFLAVVNNARMKEERMKQFRSRFIIMPNSRFRRSWDVMCLVLLAYVAVFTPLQIAFFPEMTFESWRHWAVIFFADRFVDTVFLFDIFINFRSAWINEMGHIEFDSCQGAKKYFYSWFLVDFLSIFPFEVFELSGPSKQQGGNNLSKLPRLLKLMRLAKIAKVLRASRILKRFEANFSVRYGVVRLSKFLLWSSLTSHWIACAWFIAGNTSGEDTSSWVFEQGLDAGFHRASAWDQYVASLYWALMTLTTIGYGDIRPVNELERVLAIFCMLLGSAMFAYVVGTMCSVVEGLSMTSLAFQERMDRLNEFMDTVKLPKSIRIRTRKYCIYQREAKLIRSSEREILEDLSPTLRSEIYAFNYCHVLRRGKYFTLAPTEFLRGLAQCLHLCIYGPNEEILTENHVGSSMYILLKGRAQVDWFCRKRNELIILDYLTDGSCFGELA